MYQCDWSNINCNRFDEIRLYDNGWQSLSGKITTTMTLFSLREFWSTNCGHEEEFDKTSMCISNIDNSADGFGIFKFNHFIDFIFNSIFFIKDKIIIGSYNGILRIYKVEINSENNTEQNLYQISDLLLEVDLKEPILQVSYGFLLTSANIQLAVLHPNQLCVYSVSCN